MKALPHTIIALALLIGGIFAGRGMFSAQTMEDSSGSSVVSSPLRSSRTATPIRATEEKPADKHDLEGLRIRMREWSENSGGLRRELERLDVPALKKTLLEQMAANAGSGGGKEWEARRGVISAFIHELYRREGPASIEWIDGIEDQTARRNAMQTVLMEAVRDHPDTALPWIRKLQGNSRGNSPMEDTFTRLAFAGAARRGADEVIRIHDMFSDSLRGSPLGSARFPADFDYEKFHVELSGKIDMADAFTQWAVRDKEAAWQGVRRDLDSRGQPGARYFGSLVVGVVAEQGEEAGVKWAVARIAELSPEQRKLCLPNLDHMGKLTTEGISAITSGLSPEDRKSFANGMINGFRGGEKVLVALEALPRGELLEVLQKGAKRHATALNAPQPNSSSERMRHLYHEAERRFSLTPEEIRNIHAADGTQ